MFVVGAGSLKTGFVAPIHKLLFGAGDGGVEQGAAVWGLRGGGKPHLLVFRALAFVGGDGVGGFVFGQAAERDAAVAAAVCAFAGEAGAQVVAVVFRLHDDADVAVVELLAGGVAGNHDDLPRIPRRLRAGVPVLLQQGAVKVVDVLGIVAQRGEHN